VVDPVAFSMVVRVMSVVAAASSAVNAAELLTMSRVLSERGIWRPTTMAASWGAFRVLLSARGFRAVLALQLLAALGLALGGWRGGTDMPWVAACAATLASTTLLSAMRFGHTVNGGSDAMLFTVLAGLTLAWWPFASTVVHEAGVLYVAAQLTLSYVRAGWVKLRQRDWWTGRALRAFTAFPAYGVPIGIVQAASQHPLLTRLVGVSAVLFELSAPLAWWQPITCALFITVAILFHLGTAVIFGLSRFLLAWSAALPSLWYAMVRVA